MSLINRNPESNMGTWGWVGLVAGVMVFDALSKETLTDAWRRGLEKPLGKFALGAVAGITVGHLMDVPNRYGTPDFINNIGDIMGWVGEKL